MDLKSLYNNVSAESSGIHQVQQPGRHILLILKGQLWAEHLVPNQFQEVMEIC